MKLIIVQRSRVDTFRRLKEKFVDDLNVEVVLERRVGNRRQHRDARGPERRAHERRRLLTDWNGHDYIVIHVADMKKTA